MSFKDEIQSDLDAVFMQSDEFAAHHRVEGKEIACIVDSDRGQRKSDGAMYDLAEMDFVLIAKTADLPPRKAAGNLLNLDGKELTVSTWDEQDGITIIGLLSPESA